MKVLVWLLGFMLLASVVHARDICIISDKGGGTYYVGITSMEAPDGYTVGQFYNCTTKAWVATNAIANAATEKGGTIGQAIYCVTIESADFPKGMVAKAVLRDSAVSAGAVVGLQTVYGGQ